MVLQADHTIAKQMIDYFLEGDLLPADKLGDKNTPDLLSRISFPALLKTIVINPDHVDKFPILLLTTATVPSALHSEVTILPF